MIEASEAAKALLGSLIDGRFRLDEVIRDGSMGTVYRATQTSIDRAVAVKVLSKRQVRSASNVERFMREARIISDLTHPNVVRLLDFGEDTTHDVLFLAMEFLDGVTLTSLMARGRLSVDLAIEVIHQACGALTEPHARDVVHRDLNPDNLLLVPMADGSFQVKVVDFGVARALEGDTRVTADGVIRGTPTYMAPEQAQELDADGRADLYSLGVVLYEIFAGVPPFDANTSIQLILQKVQRDPAPLSSHAPDLPAGLTELVDALVSRDPADRPESALALRGRLESLMDSLRTRRVRVALDGDLPTRFDGWLTSADPVGPTAILPAITQEHAPDASPSKAATLMMAPIVAGKTDPPPRRPAAALAPEPRSDPRPEDPARPPRTTTKPMVAVSRNEPEAPAPEAPAPEAPAPVAKPRTSAEIIEGAMQSPSPEVAADVQPKRTLMMVAPTLSDEPTSEPDYDLEPISEPEYVLEPISEPEPELEFVRTPSAKKTLMMLPELEAAAPAPEPATPSKPRVVLPPAISGSSHTRDEEPDALASGTPPAFSQTLDDDWEDGDWNDDDMVPDPEPEPRLPSDQLNTGQRNVFGFSPEEYIQQTQPVDPTPVRDLPGVAAQSEPVDASELPGIYTQSSGLGDEASVAEDAGEEAFLVSDPDRAFDIDHLYEDDAYPEAKSSRNVVIPIVIMIGLLIFGGVAALVSSDLGRDVDAENTTGVASTDSIDPSDETPSDDPSADGSIAPTLSATDDTSSIRGLAGGEPTDAPEAKPDPEADPATPEDTSGDEEAPKKKKKATRRKVKTTRKKPTRVSLDTDLPPRRVDPRETAPDPKPTTPAKKPKKVEDKLKKELDWLKQR